MANPTLLRDRNDEMIYFTRVMNETNHITIQPGCLNVTFCNNR